MVNLKQIGGIILVAVTGLMFACALGAWLVDGYAEYLWVGMVYLIVLLLGGILAIMGKTIGGIIALVVGALWLSTAILLNVGVYPITDWVLSIMQSPLISLFEWYLNINVWGYLYVETLIVLAGAILVVVDRSD